MDGGENLPHIAIGHQTREIVIPSPFIIVIIYIIGIIIWIIMIVVLKLYLQPTVLSVVILMIPIVIFTFGIINAGVAVNTGITRIAPSYLPFGLLVIVPLLTLIGKEYNGNKDNFITVIIVSIILLLLSVLDVPVRNSIFPYASQLRSIFETTGITLIIFALYMFLCECVGKSTKRH